jgi:hypothetical protein
LVWKDVTVGFTVVSIIAAFVPKNGSLLVAVTPILASCCLCLHIVLEWLFVGASGTTFGKLFEQCIVGPVASCLTFIGHMGNIPLAAVLYSNNVLFNGILAFIFSDLAVFPVLRLHAKYFCLEHGTLHCIFVGAIVITAIILQYIFKATWIIPSSKNIPELISLDFSELNYNFGPNVVFLLSSAAFFGVHFSMHGGSSP